MDRESQTDPSSGAPAGQPASPPKRRFLVWGATLLVTAVGAAALTALLTNIFEHKQEAKNPYLPHFARRIGEV